MRVSQVIGDIHASIREIVNALANRLHAEDNFAPDGEVGQVLTSRGPNQPPNWQDGGAGASGVQGPQGLIGPTGPTGATGPTGPGTEPADDEFIWMPMTTIDPVSGDVTFLLDADGSIVPNLFAVV